MPRRSPGSYRVGIARREAILEAAVRHFAKGGYHRTAMARIAADPGVTGAGVLRRLLEMTGRQLEEPGLIELFVLVSAEAADTSSPAHRLFAERYDSAVDGLAARLRRAVDSGEFRADTDCTAIARECIAVSDGLQLQWVLSGGTLDLTAAVRAPLERVARAVTADGSGLGD
ncbi:hypothetical protein FHR83_005730 [Actinoplanes campanulatus]|uniref:Transcriptional regulator, TetR family n=1 Tax=Actinoplanes campanulatus TaxID=113559 RepID=A0A7W5AL19_9ACTN|nr:TetR family transcriptional regulator C-terminal domain-containing protein [Actinoplanes campanulatus]MBB3098045.1 hypothetical protein [Actinoplanes campanulatus]GGN32087.1 TetR family transcriptional regulator [Actinoplanes campanulatus]GID40084.1 TetR family transcriptional regulator [Actinoplanes campanulatus]